MGRHDRRQRRGGGTAEPNARSGIPAVTGRVAAPGEETSRAGRGARTARRRRRRALAFGCLAALIVIFAAITVVGLVYLDGINDNLRAGLGGDASAASALARPAEDARSEPFYMVIMGVDSREEGEDARSDTLMLARIDAAQQRVSLVSIPRDTRVSIPGHGRQKINAARALGGPALVIQTVSDMTGLPVKHYLELDFQGFKEVVDALGGVTVDVPEAIYDMKAANHVETAARLEAGPQVLDGAHALTFVRSRAFPLGDFQRIENQQVFLRAVMAEALKRDNVLRLPSVIGALSKSVTTDMSIGEMLSLANQLKGMSDDDLETVTMPGEPENIGGVSYVIMDEEAFERMMAHIAQGQPAEEPTAEDGRPLPASVSVSVRNGAGVAGVAADASRRLRVLGFAVGEVGNMGQFDYQTTYVVYKTRQDKAELVSDSLGLGQVVASRGRYSFEGDVLLVVGKDWGPPQRPDRHQIPVD